MGQGPTIEEKFFKLFGKFQDEKINCDQWIKEKIEHKEISNGDKLVKIKGFDFDLSQKQDYNKLINSLRPLPASVYSISVQSMSHIKFLPAKILLKAKKFPEYEESNLVSLDLTNFKVRKSLAIISHPWRTKDHPDPDGLDHLNIVKILKKNSVIKFVFLDYSCLPQKTKEVDKKLRKLFDDRLSEMTELYNHYMIHVKYILICEGDFFNRAWCFSEFSNFRGKCQDNEMFFVGDEQHFEEMAMWAYILRDVVLGNNQLFPLFIDMLLRLSITNSKDLSVVLNCLLNSLELNLVV